MSLEQLLKQWIPQQRWFATKSAPIDELRTRELAVLAHSADLRFTLQLVDVDTLGRTDYYFVPLAWHRSGDDDTALVGALDGWVLRDGALDASCNALLLDLITAGASVGEVSAGRADGLAVAGGPGRPLGVEQSNTSLVYDEAVVLKLFRRLTESPNPDLEVTRALGAVGSPHVAPALGWVDGAGFTLAMVQPYLKGGTEGWELALTSIRDLYAQPEQGAEHAGGDFAPEAERLGAVTAGLHKDLKAAFGAQVVTQAELAELASLMHDRLKRGATAVPQLAALASRIGAAYDAVARLDSEHVAQRIHGDLHLGQVLRTQTGWVVLDFEGEPARPVHERVAAMSPLRDVAGMLRSFDYAAKHLIADHDRSALLDLRAEEWTRRNRDAFCTGYAAAAGRDPRQDAVLLRAFELDKAVYEVRYEADHRPGWLSIPLNGVERLVA